VYVIEKLTYKHVDVIHLLHKPWRWDT